MSEKGPQWWCPSLNMRGTLAEIRVAVRKNEPGMIHRIDAPGKASLYFIMRKTYKVCQSCGCIQRMDALVRQHHLGMGETLIGNPHNTFTPEKWIEYVPSTCCNPLCVEFQEWLDEQPIDHNESRSDFDRWLNYHQGRNWKEELTEQELRRLKGLRFRDEEDEDSVLQHILDDEPRRITS